MAKVIFEQFDGGLQKDWFKTTTSNRAYKNQKKNGIAYGCVNPFINEGVLVPGNGLRTVVTDNTSLTNNSGSPIASNFVEIGDNNLAVTAASMYIGIGDDLHAITSGLPTVQTVGWPQSLSDTGTHSGHSFKWIEKILDYQVNGIRKQLVFFRDFIDWDCAYYSGITGTQGEVTFTRANPGVFTKSSHGLNTGDTVRIIGGVLPTNIVSGTTYYVVWLSDNTFSLATTKANAFVPTKIDTTAGAADSGTHLLYPGLQTEGMSLASGYSVNQILHPENSGFNNRKPIIAIASDNGYCYFGNGSAISKFDGTSAGGINGTITGSVLSFSTNREIVDMVDGLGKIWILTRAESKSNSTSYVPGGLSRTPSVVVWNRQSTTVGIEDNIPINAIDAHSIYIHDGVPYVWATVAGNQNKLFAFDGKTFKTVADIGQFIVNTHELTYGYTHVGIPSIKSGSIASYNNGILWSDANSNIFWYGSVNPSMSTPEVYWISRARNIEKSPKSSGSVLVGGSTLMSPKIFTAYHTTTWATGIDDSYYTVSYFNPENTSELNSGTTTYTSAIELPKLSTIDGVTIFFNENTNADSGTTSVNIYNSWKKTASPYCITKTIDHDVDIPRGWVYFPLNMGNSNLVQLSFTYNGTTTIANSPQITRIEVDYSTTTKKR
jgi:hypothetical protein